MTRNELADKLDGVVVAIKACRANNLRLEADDRCIGWLHEAAAVLRDVEITDAMVGIMYKYLKFRSWNAGNLRAALEAALSPKAALGVKEK